MNPYLKEYQLTDEGKRVASSSGKIHLPANSKGDSNHVFNLKTIHDQQAKALFDRRDGKGRKLVGLKKQPPQSKEK